MAMCVAPYTGAWIEIFFVPPIFILIMSHPTRVRGLKYCLLDSLCLCQPVAPYTGAWIEIIKSKISFSN